MGVIQVGHLTLEILPKTDHEGADWRSFLLDMLDACHKVKREVTSSAKLKQRANSLLDLYLQILLDEVQAVVGKGLVKQYGRKRSQQKALRGKLLIEEQLRKNFIHQERFFTEHPYYTVDNVYNQVLKKALQIICTLPCDRFYQKSAEQLLSYFSRVRDLSTVSSTLFDRLSFDRNKRYYFDAIQIARLIILNYSPDISSGATSLLAILFDMNKLREENIYRQLLLMNHPEYTVTAQNRAVFWKSSQYERGIRPDIVLRKGEQTIVIDTKWKVIDQAKPSDEDLKQLVTYNIYWDCTHSLLLYPRTLNSPDNSPGTYSRGMPRKVPTEGEKDKEREDSSHQCSVCFVDIVGEDGRLKRNIGEEVLKVIS